MKQKYIDLVENIWGEDEDFAEALFSMLGEDEKLFERVVKEDLSFNRYTCDVSTWGDLLETIIQDPCFEDEEYADEDGYCKIDEDYSITDYNVQAFHHSGDMSKELRKFLYKKFGIQYAEDFLLG